MVHLTNPKRVEILPLQQLNESIWMVIAYKTSSHIPFCKVAQEYLPST
ncbi:MAG: hypothetical protein JO235_10015 [Chroococcidiopsidaceae cyanobacterium CP_BM_RX_35]|nr:hypothetical protein [Chroococcidiopsidaceae cyanobacterium CP_BM_RX_35]